MNLPEQQVSPDFSHYELQAIMAESQLRPTWYELLYRPSLQNIDIEDFFATLSDIKKVDFDFELFSHLPKIQQKHWPLSLSININPISLADNRFLTLLSYLLDKQDVSCNKLCFEIVESGALPTLPEHALDCLYQFKKQGGLIALDDFGTGHTHWELIHRGLVDIIKIAAHKHKEKNNHKVLKALSRFSKGLDLATVFEGVETEEDLVRASSLGATHYQGWYFDQWKIAST